MKPVDPHDEERAFQRLLAMLNASEQSSAKVRKKLSAAGYDDFVVDGVIERAKELGILDDARYAEVLVRSTISQGKGFRPVSVELEGLGIALDEVEAFQEYDEQQRLDPSLGDSARALALLEAHPPKAKNLRDAAFRKLMSKGYDIDVCTSVARDWAAARL